jgi:hypothetical protein
VVNVRPWEFGRLTVDEFDMLAQYLEDRASAIRKAEKGDG